MSSIDRPLSGDVLVASLLEGPDVPTAPDGGRSARTILKEGPLRVTLVTVAPGGEIPEHRADGPITVQPISGRLRFTAAGAVHDLAPGQLLALGAGITHTVASAEGATFLLTLCKGSGTEPAK